MNQLILGDVEVTRVAEMHGPIGMTPQQFFPGSPGESWEEQRPVLVPDFLDEATGICEVAMQTWLLRSQGRTILVDTGVGNGKDRPAVPSWNHLDLDYLGALERAGVKPADVDMVVNTHLHLDHIGWNTRLQDGEWVPTFPNATYVMPKADFEYWNPANNPRIAGGTNENAFEDSVAPVLSAGQVELWETSYRIDSDLVLEPAPGHTPGSSVITLSSGGDRAVFAGDVLHSPFQVAHPDHSSCFCEDAVQAGDTRRKLMARVADTGTLVIPAHFTGHGAFEVDRRGDGFRIKGWAALGRL